MPLPLINTSTSSEQVARAIQHGAGANGLNRIMDPLPPEKLEGEVISWADRAVRQADEEAAQSVNSKLMPRIMQYMSGNQWPSRPTAYGNSRPVNNRMFRQYWELVSLLTDGNPEPYVRVFDKRDSFSDMQSVLSDMLELWGDKPHYRSNLQDVVGWGLLAKGIAKLQWNPNSNNGFGDMELLSINPMNFATLGGDGSIDNAECVIETRKVTLASLQRKFGRLAEGIEPDATSAMGNGQVMRPGQLSSAEWSKLSPQMQRIIGKKTAGSSVNDELYPMATLRLFWMLDPAYNEQSWTVRVGPKEANWSYFVEPGMPLYPRGRVLTVGGNGTRARVLNDTCNPYFSGGHPYVEFIPLRAPWSSDGMSLMGQQIGPQDILNRVMAGMLETLKAGLTPTIIAPRNAVSRSDMDNMSTTISGGKLEYNPMSPQAPSFRTPPQMPQQAMPFTQMVMTEMDKTTGSAAVDAAAQKEQVPSHDTMEMIQNSRSYMVRLMGRQLEIFMNKAGQKIISGMLQFYSVGHRVAILGAKGILASDFNPMYGSALPNGMLPEEFVRKFQFSVKPGSSMTFGKEQRAQIAMLLRRTGDISRNMMFKALDANIDVHQNEQELQAEALQKLGIAALAGAAAGQAKGGRPPVHPPPQMMQAPPQAAPPPPAPR